MEKCIEVKTIFYFFSQFLYNPLLVLKKSSYEMKEISQNMSRK